MFLSRRGQLGSIEEGRRVAVEVESHTMVLNAIYELTIAIFV